MRVYQMMTVMYVNESDLVSNVPDKESVTVGQLKLEPKKASRGATVVLYKSPTGKVSLIKSRY